MIKQLTLIKIFTCIPFITSMEPIEKPTYAQIVKQSQVKPLSYLAALKKSTQSSSTIQKNKLTQTDIQRPYIPRSESEESLWHNLSGLQKKKDLERQRNNNYKKKQFRFKRRTFPKLEENN